MKHDHRLLKPYDSFSAWEFAFKLSLKAMLCFRRSLKYQFFILRFANTLVNGTFLYIVELDRGVAKCMRDLDLFNLTSL